MSLSKETLKRMILDIRGPELNDEELEQVLAQVEMHRLESNKLRQLDMSKVLPARLMRSE